MSFRAVFQRPANYKYPEVIQPFNAAGMRDIGG
jgi:hypothetical protein